MKTIHEARILPSLLSADMGRLADAVAMLEDAGCTLFHLDIMDGHFVPNLTFGPPVVKALCRAAKQAEFCVHLMVNEPEKLIESFVHERVKYLTVHAEACPHLHRTLTHIRSLGPLPGVALNPSTHPSSVEYVLQEAALVLVMTVNPGWGGQSFIEPMLEKIKALANRREYREDFDFVIEVDGGIDANTAPRVLEAGARLLVAGNAVYGQSDPAKAYRKLTEMAANA